MEMNRQTSPTYSYRQESGILMSGIGFSVAGFIWGFIYILLDEQIAGYIPISFAILLLIPLFLYVQYNTVLYFLYFELTMLLLLPFGVHFALGGFHNSSLVILWSLLPFVVAYIYASKKVAQLYLLSFIGLLAAAFIASPFLDMSTNLPDQVITIFYYMNSVVVGLVILYGIRRIRLMNTEEINPT